MKNYWKSKVYEEDEVTRKTPKLSKTKREQSRSIALKARKESSDEDSSTSDSEMKNTPWRRGRRSWSDSDDDEEEEDKGTKSVLWPKDSNEATFRKNILECGSNKKRQENQAKNDPKTEHGWKRLCKIKAKSKNAKVESNKESAVKTGAGSGRIAIGCNLNPSDGPGSPMFNLKNCEEPNGPSINYSSHYGVILTKTVKTLKAQSSPVTAQSQPLSHKTHLLTLWAGKSPITKRTLLGLKTA
ncbi:hypothetical protein Tco_0600831 [Tanacetum coccineum]